MSSKLYVCNLPYSFDDMALKKLFLEFGSVEEAKVITDRNSGKSKGFGFVTLSDNSQSDKAIERLNGRKIEGRPLKVSLSQENGNKTKSYTNNYYSSNY